MTKILIKRGQAEANLPTLDPGEPAITFDSGGKLWIGTPSGNLEITGGGSGSPGGSDTQLQFNNSGSFGGATSLIYDNSLNDFRIYGDGNNSLFHSDFSANTIGFGTNGATGTIALFSPSIIVYNEDGQDVDFRVEGENFSNLFKVDAGLDAVQIGTAAAGTIADFRSSGTVFNDEGEDRDFRIEGDTATNLVVIDASLDAFQVGTTVVGAIADFRSTEIVFNNAEADVDIRWGGNGVTNGVYFDAGNIRFGINTVPSVAFHVVEDSGTVAIFEENASGEVGINSFYNPNTTDNNGSLIRFDTDTTGTGATARSQIAQIGVVFTTHNHATRTGNIVFRNYQSGAFGTRMTIGAGIQVGSPTGGDKGAGTANFAGDIYKNNTAYTNPDYALEHWVVGEIKKFTNRGGAEGYYRLSIDESEKFVKENLHLPRISRDPVGIFGMADMALEKIEEAHVYIYELNYRIKRLEELLDLN